MLPAYPQGYGYYTPYQLAPSPPPPQLSPLIWTPAAAKLDSNGRLLAIAALLRQMRYSPMDFVIALLGQGPEFDTFRKGFYDSQGLEQLLNVMESNKRGVAKLRTCIRPRAIKLVKEEVYLEMEELTSYTHMSTNDITPQFLMTFDLRKENETFADTAPVLHDVLMTSCQTDRSASENKLKKPETFCTMILAQLAKFRSQNSQMVAIPCGLYFFSTGMARKPIDMLAHCGMCPSYSTVQSSHVKLADSQMVRTRMIAHTTGFSNSWDNTQISTSRHVEQRDLAPAKVQTGTTSLILELRNAPMSSLSLQSILERRARLDIITYSADIRPSLVQCGDLIRSSLISILRIFIDHSGEDLSYLNDAPELRYREYRPPEKGHRTVEHVLRTTTLDEGSIDGTIEVNEDIFLDQLAFKIHDLNDRAVPSFNDQRTNTLIRSAQQMRKNDIPSAILRLLHLQLGIGWFHLQLNLAWMILRIHKGITAEVGSLQHYIALLGITRLGGEHPDYETLIALFFEVLSGHLLYYWELETGLSATSIAAAKLPAATLLGIADRIFQKYFSDKAIQDPNDASQTDFAPYNIKLLNRDLLTFYLLDLAVSSGDFGRVEILLGPLTMMFAGGGCKNYTTELLCFIQNLKKVWTPEFANVMRDNSLISISGRKGHYIGVDKNTEHNINFQKAYYTAKGVHGTWEQLANLSPNIPIYRALKTQFGEFMGSSRQGTTHSKTDNSGHVQKVKFKAKEYKIHHADARLLHTDAEGKTKEVVRSQVARKSADIIESGKSMLQGKTLTGWEKRYRSWVNGEGLIDEENEPAGV